jgi:hypothetical protein
MISSALKQQIIMFLVMVVIGMSCNPMNILAYRLSDLYISLTLFYGGILMASNMIWAHEIVHYLHMGHFNVNIFIIGLSLSFITSVVFLRNQLFVDDKQWLKRMISHHSTALTTSHNIYKKTNDEKIKKLAKSIIDTQENEINIMKEMLIS